MKSHSFILLSYQLSPLLMKTKLTRKEAQQSIDEFFRRKDFTAEECRKIKRLAMKFNIKLGSYRKFFCKECLSKLEGKIRINKIYKAVECKNCSYKNKFKF